jgi:hypothetical protein
MMMSIRFYTCSTAIPAKCETIEAIRLTTDGLLRRTFAASKRIDNEKSIHLIANNDEGSSYGRKESVVSDIE